MTKAKGSEAWCWYWTKWRRSLGMRLEVLYYFWVLVPVDCSFCCRHLCTACRVCLSPSEPQVWKTTAFVPSPPFWLFPPFRTARTDAQTPLPKSRPVRDTHWGTSVTSPRWTWLDAWRDPAPIVHRTGPWPSAQGGEGMHVHLNSLLPSDTIRHPN